MLFFINILLHLAVDILQLLLKERINSLERLISVQMCDVTFCARCDFQVIMIKTTHFCFMQSNKIYNRISNEKFCKVMLTNILTKVHIFYIYLFSTFVSYVMHSCT